MTSRQAAEAIRVEIFNPNDPRHRIAADWRHLEKDGLLDRVAIYVLRSAIGATEKMRATLRTLNLQKAGDYVLVHEPASHQLSGALRIVAHMLKKFEDPLDEQVIQVVASKRSRSMSMEQVILDESGMSRRQVTFRSSEFANLEHYREGSAATWTTFLGYSDLLTVARAHLLGEPAEYAVYMDAQGVSSREVTNVARAWDVLQSQNPRVTFLRIDSEGESILVREPLDDTSLPGLREFSYMYEQTDSQRLAALIDATGSPLVRSSPHKLARLLLSNE